MNLRKILASFVLLGLLVVPAVTRAQTSSLDSLLESLSQQLSQISSIVSGLRASQLGAVATAVSANPVLSSYADWLITGPGRTLEWDKLAFSTGVATSPGYVEVWMCPASLTTFSSDSCVRSYSGTDAPNTGSRSIGLPYNDAKLVAGLWKVYVRGLDVADDSGAGFTPSVKLVSGMVPPDVTPPAQEPTFTVNDVGPGGTLILGDRDYGYKVSVVNPSKVSCSVVSKTFPSVTVTESLNLPGSNPSSYPGDYFPKNASLDTDSVELKCAGYPDKVITVKIKPKIQEGSFVASRKGNNIEYRWKTSSGVKANAPDGTLTCQIRQNNKYYQTNTIGLAKEYKEITSASGQLYARRLTGIPNCPNSKAKGRDITDGASYPGSMSIGKRCKDFITYERIGWDGTFGEKPSPALSLTPYYIEFEIVASATASEPLASPSATVSDTLSNVSNNHGSKVTGKTQFKSVAGPCKTNNVTVKQYCVIDAYLSCTSRNGLSTDEVRASYNLDLANHY